MRELDEILEENRKLKEKVEETEVDYIILKNNLDMLLRIIGMPFEIEEFENALENEISYDEKNDKYIISDDFKKKLEKIGITKFYL